MLQFWCLKFIYQVCKLYFYFWHVRNFAQYFYLSVFSKEWKGPTFSLVKYMLFSQKSLFLYSLEAKNPRFLTKTSSEFGAICVSILCKKHNLFQKNFHTLTTLIFARLVFVDSAETSPICKNLFPWNFQTSVREDKSTWFFFLINFR